MSLRTEILPVADELRALSGPQAFDIRTSQLTVRTRSWSGGRPGLGTNTDVDLVIDQIYKIQHVSASEIASSGGRYEAEDIKVGPVTPAWFDAQGNQLGGHTPAQLKPNGDDATEIVYVLTSTMYIATEGEYTLVQLHTERPFGFLLVIRRRRTTP
jgi:hypothetical protein